MHMSFVFRASITLLASLLAQENIHFTFAAKRSFNQRQPQKYLTRHCHTLILGGGIAGIYAAYKLAPFLREKLCLVEKENYFGGRIYDVPEVVTSKHAPGVFGVGALRLTRDHANMMALARQLNLTLEAAPHDKELYHIRGSSFLSGINTADNSTHMCRAFPELRCNSRNPSGDMWDRLTKAYADRSRLPDYSKDMIGFILDNLGPGGLEYLEHTTRALTLLGAYSTLGIMDLLAKSRSHPTVSPPPKLYPVGGMSSFIEGLIAAISQNGAQLFTGTLVTRLDAVKAAVLSEVEWPMPVSGRFFVKTNRGLLRADRVLVAIDPLNLRSIGGHVIQRLKRQPQFQAIVPVPVVTVAAWWSRKWWNDSAARIMSSQSRFKIAEFLLTPYASVQNVTRVAYTDDSRYIETWRSLIAQGDEALKVAGQREMQRVYGDTVPRPRTVKAHIWPNGWHFQKPESPFANDDIGHWAVEPIRGMPVALIGDGYLPGWTAWAEGAILSTINSLEHHFQSLLGKCTCDETAFSKAAGICAGTECHPRVARSTDSQGSVEHLLATRF